jgi:hypothetical protein
MKKIKSWDKMLFRILKWKKKSWLNKIDLILRRKNYKFFILFRDIKANYIKKILEINKQFDYIEVWQC